MSRRVERFRDHCAKMATAQHKPGCPSLGPKSRPVWQPYYDPEAYPDDGANPVPAGMRLLGFTPSPPKCDGCLSDADRALFAQMATEAEAYIQGDLLEDA